jgi:hypothetical protein
VRPAACWTISVGFCVGLTALLKIFFYGCPPASDIRSPSGHTAFSVLVYGAIALVTAVQTRGLHRAVAICIGAGMILTIVVSCLLLEIHSLPEVSLVRDRYGFLDPIWSDLSAIPMGKGVAAAGHFGGADRATSPAGTPRRKIPASGHRVSWGPLPLSP